MIALKCKSCGVLAALCCALGFSTEGVTETVRRPASRSAGLRPELSVADQAFLIRLIRRTVEDVSSGRSSPASIKPSDAVANLRCPLVVTFRRGGLPVAQGQSDGGLDAAQGCREAAEAALRNSRNASRLSDSVRRQLGVELELLGPAQQLSVGLSARRRLIGQYEAGVDGVAIRLDDRNSLIRPSQIVANGLAIGDAIDFVLGRLGLSSEDIAKRKDEAECMRFRTLHLWQPVPDGPVVQLDCGCVLLAPEAVSAEMLDRGISDAARYLRDRQRTNGLFHYAYLPWADRTEDVGPTVSQPGAAWALAIHGRGGRALGSTQAAARTIAAMERSLVTPNVWKPGVKSTASSAASQPVAAYLISPDQADRVGATALLLLAASEMEPSVRYRSLRAKLGEALVTRQLPTGMLQTNFVTTRDVAPQDIDGGQTLCAMARHYEVDRSAGALSVVKNAYDHYRKQFDVSPTVEMVPWLGIAYACAAQVTGESRYADFVFAMVDWLERFQLSPDTSESPLMWGGVDAFGHGAANVSTAVYMIAVADALGLARRVKDEPRSRRYERMLRLGTRFVLQLQFRPEECYYVRSRVDTVGGIRTAPWDHALTIENCQMALVALVKAKELLFGGAGGGGQ